MHIIKTQSLESLSHTMGGYIKSSFICLTDEYVAWIKWDESWNGYCLFPTKISDGFNITVPDFLNLRDIIMLEIYKNKEIIFRWKDFSLVKNKNHHLYFRGKICTVRFI